MKYKDPYRRIRFALGQLRKHVPDVEVAPPAPPGDLDALIDVAGPLAPGLDAYFACCNGVGLEDPSPPLLSAEDMLGIGAPDFLAICDDLCGNRFFVAQKSKTGMGAVVFWDHEADRIDQVVAPSVASFVEDWIAAHIRAAGVETSLGAPRPDEEKELVKLRSSRRFLVHLTATSLYDT